MECNRTTRGNGSPEFDSGLAACPLTQRFLEYIMTFDLRITASATAHVVRRECGGDWRKVWIQRALACADVGASVSLIKGGSPGVKGDLWVNCDKSSQEWLERLADMLEGSSIQHRTGAGVGGLVDALIALAGEWELRQQTAV